LSANALYFHDVITLAFSLYLVGKGFARQRVARVRYFSQEDMRPAGDEDLRRYLKWSFSGDNGCTDRCNIL